MAIFELTPEQKDALDKYFLWERIAASALDEAEECAHIRDVAAERCRELGVEP